MSHWQHRSEPKPKPCPKWSLRCWLRLEPSELGWLGPDRSELWMVCKRCGARRLYLTKLNNEGQLEETQ